ncbi:MAG TPA: pyridoxal phosphate-dependent aminotransferase [Anaeromyxobacteraceae bacterium]|nr:pyridoxal phosphate-dependent aminotransferase [Anaeromyxobacteraceae bacterium]
MFSRRTGWDLAANSIADRIERRRAAGRLVDLTETNPTRCGLEWPAAELAAALTAPALSRYDPTPRGSEAARAAVVRYLADRGASATVEQVVLTASTSEAYGLVLKLLCDPGDEILAPTPSYPLLDLLAGVEGVRLVRYPLHHAGEWHLDRAALAAAVTERTRAVLAVSPGNPTGAALTQGDLEFLDLLCAERGIALVGDEVFADSAPTPGPSVAAARRALAFHLSGASKVCGVPQLKAAWIAVVGPPALADAALERLDVLADTALSISGPAQLALPYLLDHRESFLARLRERLATNRAELARAVAGGAPLSVLSGRGGWSDVLKVGTSMDEEALVSRLLDDGVAVHPGFFYDFERPGHLVVSLLVEPGAFAEGVRLVAARLHAM